jgi:hypothetical protein
MHSQKLMILPNSFWIHLESLCEYKILNDQIEIDDFP